MESMERRVFSAEKIFEPIRVDRFDESNRRSFDFSCFSLVTSLLDFTELFFQMMTMMIIYEIVITINGTRYTEMKRK